MSAFVTQIEIIRGETKSIVEKLVASFVVGKCVKRVQYVFHRSEQLSRAACEAYVYYTTPEAPLITINGVATSLSTVRIYGNILNDLSLNLSQQGVVFNLTGNPTIEDTVRYITPPMYGNYTKDIVNLRVGITYYFRVYTLTCLGYTYSEQIAVMTKEPILDTYLIPILDTNNEYIFDTY